MVAGIVIMITGWTPIDPILSLFVSGLIALSAWPLLRDVLHVLMEGVPRDVNAGEVSRALSAIEGVRSVHDLHIWTLSSSQRALAAHVEIGQLAEWTVILPKLEAVLVERFSISHTTLQPENRATAQACIADGDCGATTA